jgi:hypothetical protein
MDFTFDFNREWREIKGMQRIPTAHMRRGRGGDRALRFPSFVQGAQRIHMTSSDAGNQIDCMKFCHSSSFDCPMDLCEEEVPFVQGILTPSGIFEDRKIRRNSPLLLSFL